MQLFYAPELTVSSNICTVKDQEALHITKVLRHVSGDLLWFTNGSGTLFKTRLTTVQKKSVELEIIDFRNYPPPPFASTTLAVGLLKSREKLELITEKATEIGVGELIFFQSERTGREKIRTDRMEQILIAAMKQSLQVWKPRLRLMSSVSEILLEKKGGRIFMAHEKSELGSISDLVSGSDTETLLLIGPEGGFSDAEVQLARESGAQLVSLGRTRLRTETAALVMLARFNRSDETGGIPMYTEGFMQF